MSRHAHSQRGMSLIEVLVAILIFAIGVLGLVALQTKATQSSVDAEDRSRAALLANEAISLIWTYQTATLPAAVYSAWQARVPISTSPYSGLPGGAGTITTDANNVTTITITWQEPSHKNLSGVLVPSQYTTSIQKN